MATSGEVTTHRVGDTINVGSFQISPEVRRLTPEEAQRVREKLMPLHAQVHNDKVTRGILSRGFFGRRDG